MEIISNYKEDFPKFEVLHQGNSSLADCRRGDCNIFKLQQIKIHVKYMSFSVLAFSGSDCSVKSKSNDIMHYEIVHLLIEF